MSKGRRRTDTQNQRAKSRSTESITRTNQTFPAGGEELLLAMSLELAAATWKVALHDGRREKPEVHAVAQPKAPARL